MARMNIVSLPSYQNAVGRTGAIINIKETMVGIKEALKTAASVSLSITILIYHEKYQCIIYKSHLNNKFDSC